MTRRDAPNAVAGADPRRRAAGSRRRRAAPGEPVNATTTTSAPPAGPGFYADLARALRALPVTAALPRPGPTCCGGGCAIPACYDRANGVWRHLTDLNRCLRPDQAPNHDGDRE